MPKDLIRLLPLVAAGVTIALGALGLLNPSGAQSFTGVRASAKEGVSEVRATYGGFFLALGIMALVTREPWVYYTVGAAWCGAAGARIVSLFVDKVWTPKNLGAVLFEGLIGVGFLAPWFQRIFH
jgi:hypothetical protein